MFLNEDIQIYLVIAEEANKLANSLKNDPLWLYSSRNGQSIEMKHTSMMDVGSRVFEEDEKNESPYKGLQAHIYDSSSNLLRE